MPSCCNTIVGQSAAVSHDLWFVRPLESGVGVRLARRGRSRDEPSKGALHPFEVRTKVLVLFDETSSPIDEWALPSELDADTRPGPPVSGLGPTASLLPAITLVFGVPSTWLDAVGVCRRGAHLRCLENLAEQNWVCKPTNLQLMCLNLALNLRRIMPSPNNFRIHPTTVTTPAAKDGRFRLG